MPFSGTDTCTKDEWTEIFDGLIKPAVEESGLGFSCYRSSATRGNIVAAIMESLRDAYVVIADLTDQNANVFYELGVRHSLQDRTILIAQDREFIPFDLGAYANHVYGWRTPEGQAAFRSRIRELLEDVDQNPNRSDNPVRDFLKSRVEPIPSPSDDAVAPAEVPFAQPLAGSGSEGLDAHRLAQTVISADTLLGPRTIVRLTRVNLSAAWLTRIEELNTETKPEKVALKDIVQYCTAIIEPFEQDILKIEEFGLALVEAEYFPGIDELMRFIEDWISLSDRVWGGTSSRPATGAPSLMALRLVMNWCAKAVDITSVRGLGVLLTRPLATVESTGQPSTLALVDRRDLFWPSAMLGYADKAVEYISTRSWENPGLRRMFASEQEYKNGLAVALFIAELIHGARNPETLLLYPGFKLIEGSSAAIEHFRAKLASDDELVTALAGMADESASDFRAKWSDRVSALDASSLGGRHDIWIDWPRTTPDL